MWSKMYYWATFKTNCSNKVVKALLECQYKVGLLPTDTCHVSIMRYYNFILNHFDLMSLQSLGKISGNLAVILSYSISL